MKTRCLVAPIFAGSIATTTFGGSLPTSTPHPIRKVIQNEAAKIVATPTSSRVIKSQASKSFGSPGADRSIIVVGGKTGGTDSSASSNSQNGQPMSRQHPPTANFGTGRRGGPGSSGSPESSYPTQGASPRLRYLHNLTEWGDNRFKQDSTQSVNEATQQYLRGADVLGQKPKPIPQEPTGSRNKAKRHK
jgi:hypothetical protein